MYQCPSLINETAQNEAGQTISGVLQLHRGPHTLTYINKLEMVQRQVARFDVNDYSRDSSVSEILPKLEWSSLQIGRENKRLAEMYKIVQNLGAISPNTYRRNHNFNFIKNSPVIDCFKCSFSPRTVHQLIALTNDMVSVSSFTPCTEGGYTPSKRLLGMCRWTGSHFHNWTDYNGVTFLVELLEWCRKFLG